MDEKELIIMKDKLDNCIKKVSIFINVMIFISFICLMMIFIGLVIFVWYGFVEIKIVFTSLIILVISEILRKSGMKVNTNYIHELENM